jgi:hypothetical protein
MSNNIVANVVGFSQLAAPALGTIIFTHGLSSWASIPALLESGIDNFSISYWVSKYNKLSGTPELLTLLASIGFGLNAALHLPFRSFARFYYLIGAISSFGYLLFVPYFRYKTAKIADYSNAHKSDPANPPRKEIKTWLRVQFVSSLFDLAGAGFFWYGLYNAINLK